VIEVKVKEYKINEIEENRGKGRSSYFLELKIEFTSRKDRDEFIRIMRDNLR